MDCIFCRPQRQILAETKLSLAVLDGFPVSKGHTLVIPIGDCPKRDAHSMHERCDPVCPDLPKVL